MALFDQPGMIGPYTNPNVDAAQETVEGRIGGLLQTDGKGNYTNPVVQQATARQDQAFNARGLRNSSIAVQGGTEAAISKSIEIATPDANKFYDNRRGNISLEADFTKQKNAQDFDMTKQKDSQSFEMAKQNDSQQFDLDKQKDTQSFTTRQDYQKAVQNIGTNYQRQIDTINSSNMTPADKNVAIQQAAAVRDGEMAFQNNLYSRMPQWQQEWLAPSIPTGGMDMGSVSNADTLSTIVNDPGQPQATRDAAAARLSALGGGGGGTPGSSMIGGAGGGAVGTTPAGTPLPATNTSGQAINWNGFLPGTSETLRAAYSRYESNPYNGPMSPEQFAAYYNNGYGYTGGAGDAGGDGTGTGGTSGAAAGDSGDSGGVSI